MESHHHLFQLRKNKATGETSVEMGEDVTPGFVTFLIPFQYLLSLTVIII